MKKLIASIMFGALVMVGAFAVTTQPADTAMEVEPTVFSVELPDNVF